MIAVSIWENQYKGARSRIDKISSVVKATMLKIDHIFLLAL